MFECSGSLNKVHLLLFVTILSGSHIYTCIMYIKHDFQNPLFYQLQIYKFRKFLCFFSEPEEDDEEVVTSYLQNLIMDKNLEQVDLVIKFLKR